VTISRFLRRCGSASCFKAQAQGSNPSSSISVMARTGWLNLEAGRNVVPEQVGTLFFEEDQAFKSLELSKTQRLQGFIGCMIIGFVLSLVGSIVFIFGQLVPFAALYIAGTIVTLLGTGFVIGFFRQLKLMIKPIRIVATIVFIASIILVLVAAFVLGNGLLCLIFVIVEFLAYAWYTLSYIPYARTTFKKIFNLG
jgi:membrane-bound ClpP family serine protease